MAQGEYVAYNNFAKIPRGIGDVNGCLYLISGGIMSDRPSKADINSNKTVNLTGERPSFLSSQDCYLMKYNLFKITPDEKISKNTLNLLNNQNFSVKDFSWSRYTANYDNPLELHMMYVEKEEHSDSTKVISFVSCRFSQANMDLTSSGSRIWEKINLSYNIYANSLQTQIQCYDGRYHFRIVGKQANTIDRNVIIYGSNSGHTNLGDSLGKKGGDFQDPMPACPIIKIGDKYWVHLPPGKLSSSDDNQWVQIDSNNSIWDQLKSSNTVSNPLVYHKFHEKGKEGYHINVYAYREYYSSYWDRDSLHVIQRGNKFTVLQGFCGEGYKAYNDLWKDANFIPWIDKTTYNYFAIASWVADPEKGPISYYVPPNNVISTVEGHISDYARAFHRFVVYEKDGQFYVIYLTITSNSISRMIPKLGIAKLFFDDKDVAYLNTKREFTNKNEEGTFPEIIEPEVYYALTVTNFILSGHYIWIVCLTSINDGYFYCYILIDADELIQYAPQ